MDLRDRWMHTTEVADELGVSPETIRRLIRARRLRATVLVVGGRRTFRILYSDFERFRRTFTRDSIVDDWEW
jgi:excisionase family DNA binding protein